MAPGDRTCSDQRDEEIRYDGLIIATGVDLRRMPGVPHGHPRVVVVRTLADTIALHRALASNPGPVAVIGDGFIGCEVASSLREMNREVVLFGRARALLADVLGPDIGDWLTALHTARGVRLELGTTIRRWRPAPTHVSLEFADGRALEVAFVVVAVGSIPAVSWLRGAKLPLHDGVDQGLRAQLASWPASTPRRRHRHRGRWRPTVAGTTAAWGRGTEAWATGCSRSSWQGGRGPG